MLTADTCSLDIAGGRNELHGSHIGWPEVGRESAVPLRTGPIGWRTTIDATSTDRRHIVWGSVDEALTTSDRKSTRLNSSHRTISYAVFCLKKKIRNKIQL